MKKGIVECIPVGEIDWEQVAIDQIHESYMHGNLSLEEFEEQIAKALIDPSPWMSLRFMMGGLPK